jgi:hypothetical protein
MKIFNIAVLGAFATIALTGCEMRDELLGNTDKVDSGVLQLDVTVKQPLSQSRADGETVSTDDFPVTITDADGTVVKEFEKASEVPSSITLPVGSYTVAAQSKGELVKNMTSPFYQGSQSMTITKGITTQTNVVCKMANSRVQIAYGDDFKEGFQEWTIVIDDGSGQILSCTNEQTEDALSYWWFDTPVTYITVNINALTNDGNTVSESRVFRKADASEQYGDVEDTFTGGDALVVNMGAVASASGQITGITINTTITFENHDQSVEIPVAVETPISIEEPETNKYFTTGISIDDNTYPKDVKFNVTSTRGIQTANIVIASNNNDLVTYATSLGLAGDQLTNLAQTSNSTISSYFSLPKVGDKSYTLTFNEAFMKLLQNYAGEHRVRMTINDVNGNTYSRTVYVTVTKTVASTSPSVTFEGNEAEVTFSISALPDSFNAYIKAPNGIKTLLVTIDAGNQGFKEAIDDLTMDGQNFRDGVDLVENNDFNNLLENFEAGQAPKKNVTSYDFPIGTFLNVLSVYGATDAGSAHEFHITVTDENGEQASSSLKVHLTE